jgi:hypothetical protein
METMGPMPFQRYGFIGLGFGYHYVFNDLYFGQGQNDPSATLIDQDGFGWTLFGGVRLHPFLSLELGWDVLYHNTVQDRYHEYSILDGVRVAARVYVPNRSPVEPFIRAGTGFYWYGHEWHAERYAFGFSAGGGLSGRTASGLGLEAFLLYRGWVFNGFDDPSCGTSFCPYGEVYIHSINVIGGITWSAGSF